MKSFRNGLITALPDRVKGTVRLAKKSGRPGINESFDPIPLHTIQPEALSFERETYMM